MLQELDDLGFVTELANVFNTEEDIHALLAAAKIPIHSLKLARSMAPANYWRETCATLEKGLIADGLKALVLASTRLYQGNPKFRKAAVLFSASTTTPVVGSVAPSVASGTTTSTSVVPASITSPIHTGTTGGPGNALVWMHVSDLHFGHGDKKHLVEQERVIAAITRDAKALRIRLGAPTFILVTGDVAFSGKSDQYAKASSWLSELAAGVDVTDSQVFIVPGNHDVNREEVKSHASRALQEKLWSDERFLDELLSEPTDFELVWRKQQAYADFAKKFGAPEVSVSSPYWSVTRNTSLGTVAIIGLNSSIACIDDRDSPANLLLGSAQVYKTVGVSADNILIVLLRHHPSEWLRDGGNLLNQLQRHPHLDFSGHIHRQGGGVHSPFQGKGTIHFDAGAAHGGKNERVSYSYAWGRLTQRGLEYFPRLWVDGRDEFVANSTEFSLDAEDALVRETATLPDPLRNWLTQAKP